MQGRAAQLGEAAFAAKYGTGKKGKNAYGKCVSQKAKAKKDAADAADAKAIATRKSAAKTCATERKAGPAAFKAKYGTNANKSTRSASASPQGSPEGQVLGAPPACRKGTAPSARGPAMDGGAPGYSQARAPGV